MPRVSIPHQQVSRAGVIVTGAGVSEVSSDAANDHQMVNDGKVLLLVRSTDAGAQSVTFVTQGTVDGQAVGDRVESIAAGIAKAYGPFPVEIYGELMFIDVTVATLRFLALHT
jgi:hypothetical protein